MKAIDRKLFDAVWCGSIYDTELLLAHGADVNAQNKDGWTPLRMAALRNHTEIAALLLAHDANINAKDKEGWTPLHGAAMYGGRLELAVLLIKHGADVNAKNEEGETPLHMAARCDYANFAALLRKHGATE